jgi:hypothetical protein
VGGTFDGVRRGIGAFPFNDLRPATERVEGLFRQAALIEESDLIRLGSSSSEDSAAWAGHIQ